MTTIVFDSLESALRWCKGHDVSTRYIENVQGTWLMKYPGIHDPYIAFEITALGSCEKED